MDKNTETTDMKPAGIPKKDAPQAFREMAKKDTTQAKETYEKMNAATTEAADLIKNSFSTAIKGLQDYNNKVSLATAEPLKMGVAEAFNRAA
jgi:hypothetical protein